MLKVEELSVRYGKAVIVDRLSFSVDEGEWLMIAGPNGAGKSTTLKAVMQSVPSRGRILFEGEDIRKKSPRRLAQCVGMMLQSHLAEYAFSVEEVVDMGRYCRRGRFGREEEEDRRAVNEALALTGLEKIRRQSVLTLSGGELQRTFLAQIFAQDPRLLLLDEPANHLDLPYQKQVFGLIRDWLKKPGRAAVSVVHDLSLVKAYGTKALLMDHGRASSQGSIPQVMTPQNLESVYGMDVYGWMNEMLGQWKMPIPTAERELPEAYPYR